MSIIKTLLRVVIAFLLLISVIVFVGSQPLLFTPERIETPLVRSETLKSHVRQLSAFLPGRIGEEVALKPTVEWIERQLAPYGKPYRQSFTHNAQTFHNILIDFGPKQSESGDKSKEVVIIGAHYDTAHGYPGADDNASGVAALIELARLLSESEKTFSNPIQLAFYTLEEPPYFRTNKMGSYVHSEKLKADKQKVKLMISLDMIGYFTDKENSQQLPFPLMDKIYPTQGNFIALVADLSNLSAVRKVKTHFKSATDLPVYSFNAPKFVTGIDFSDHLNFWYHDYPALMITDTSFNRNMHYHTKQDTAEKLDYEKMTEVVKALYQTTISLANE